MGKSMFNELKNMKDGKWLIRIIGLTALFTYGFFVTHSTVGIDDTAIERYFDAIGSSKCSNECIQ